ncbi:hypothetical protein Xmau_03649 [Xenorhabdus mauleonii]|uniref:Uncharacterized protein n=1 Tax=Xenorhabdus mauleonii TaxID=351675 RepID=A0A1I3UY34_9GAMM|nr:hypothetical protein Xmau_03649 [Xenorhabdus mauleonii]SFJ86781.1 hypothetical protein SAMN05421680_11848 [Xenorhabdus mauleonii]
MNLEGYLAIIAIIGNNENNYQHDIDLRYQLN